MGGLRHTNVGNATARNNYAAAGQIQDGGLVFLGSVAGTNTITASATPAITAYVSGQKFSLVPANTNTGAVTININSLGAKAITKFGTIALVSGDIVAGSILVIEYDGTQFQMVTLPVGSRVRLIDVQIFTSSGTWTKPAGTIAVESDGVGGGGAGGGAPATGAGTVSAGGGGGGGGYAYEFITSGLGATETVTVGAGGTAVSGGAGNAGSASSFGAHWTANGGGGGGTVGAAGGTSFAGGASGGTATGAGVNATGGSSGPGQLMLFADVLIALSGYGGESALGGSSGPVVNAVGNAGSSFGGGGGGASNPASAAAKSGGAGAPGIVRVKSFGL